MFELFPTVRDEINVPAVLLAASTADLCFESVDADRDGELTVDEFHTWCECALGPAQVLDQWSLPLSSFCPVSPPLAELRLCLGM